MFVGGTAERANIECPHRNVASGNEQMKTRTALPQRALNNSTSTIIRALSLCKTARATNQRSSSLPNNESTDQPRLGVVGPRAHLPAAADEDAEGRLRSSAAVSSISASRSQLAPISRASAAARGTRSRATKIAASTQPIHLRRRSGWGAQRDQDRKRGRRPLASRDRPAAAAASVRRALEGRLQALE